MLGRLWRWLRGAQPKRTRLKIPRANGLDELDRSCWLRIRTKGFGQLVKRTPMPLVTCPEGHRFAIGPGHSIDGWGIVEPKVACPTCGWSALLELDGWAHE